MKRRRVAVVSADLDMTPRQATTDATRDPMAENSKLRNFVDSAIGNFRSADHGKKLLGRSCLLDGKTPILEPNPRGLPAMTVYHLGLTGQFPVQTRHDQDYTSSYLWPQHEVFSRMMHLTILIGILPGPRLRAPRQSA